MGVETYLGWRLPLFMSEVLRVTRAIPGFFSRECRACVATVEVSGPQEGEGIAGDGCRHGQTMVCEKSFMRMTAFVTLRNDKLRDNKLHYIAQRWSEIGPRK